MTMMRLVAFLALLAGAFALRKPGPLAEEAGGAAAALSRLSDEDEGEVEPNSEPEPSPATQGWWKRLLGSGGARVAGTGVAGGAVIGGLVGGLVPMGAQGITPGEDAALNGFLFGMATGVAELMYQMYELFNKGTAGLSAFFNTIVSAVSGAVGGVVAGPLVAVIKKADINNKECRLQEVQENFDLDAYISAPWYPQWQNPQRYQEADELSCTSAVYTKRDRGLWEVSVNNTGAWSLSNQEHKKTADNLCAKQQEGAKLVVAPCALLPSMGGPYWVIKYTEGPGLAHAVIIGGQPNKLSDDRSSCGYTHEKDNGMWIFTRQRVLNSGQEMELAMVKTWMKETRKLNTDKLLRTPQHDCR